MNIYVSGSLAYDRIMTFPGRFSDHIMPDKIHMLNVSFTVSGLVERLGGTAGNIAYALAMLGEKPTILSTLGHDGVRYREWLARNGISDKAIVTIAEEFTAGAYITTDQDDNQITGFNPGAMKQPSRFDLAGADPDESIAVIAPGNLDDMKAYRDVYAARGVPFIFDPGQSLPIWDGRDLAKTLVGSRVLISNDYEFALIQQRTGLDKAALLQRVKAIITTKAERGSVIITPEGELTVPAYPIRGSLVDPTGAGDAYRGGLVKGLVSGKGLVVSARMGTVCASFCVQMQGTQSYHFTPAEFEERLQKLG